VSEQPGQSISIDCLRWLGALGAIVLMTAGCWPTPHPQPAIAVRVEAVMPLPPSNRSRYSGIVRAQRQVEVAFRSGGYVDSVATVSVDGPHGALGEETRPLQSGDRVHIGMVLASLRQGDYRQRLSEATAMSAEASASQRNALTDFKRARRLLARGAISRAEYDTTKSRFDVLNGTVVAAAARAGQTRSILRDTALRSPLDGIVLDRTLEVGALVAPGAPVFVVADTSVVRLAFAVSDSVQSELAVGRRMVATSTAAPGRAFTGAVSKIAAQADPRTRTFEIEVSVDNPDLILKVGMIASVQAQATKGKLDSLVVPISAIVQTPESGDDFVLYVVTEDEAASVAHARAVRLGDLVGNRVTVLSGVQNGERVVVQGSTLVTDGVRVNVIPAPTPPSSDEKPPLAAARLVTTP
jgi:RND family efflux transporter MFP subunit